MASGEDVLRERVNALETQLSTERAKVCLPSKQRFLKQPPLRLQSSLSHLARRRRLRW